MLSLFPSLLTYELLAPFILRLTLGIVLIHWGWKGVKLGRGNEKHLGLLGIIDTLAGLLLIAGFLTQFAALVSIIILGSRLIGKVINRAFFTDGVNYYFILFVIALSLLFTGPGFFAFDLPL